MKKWENNAKIGVVGNGFGGTCFPKDMSALNYAMKDAGITPYIIPAAIERNLREDRPEQDWLLDKGRAVSE